MHYKAGWLWQHHSTHGKTHVIVKNKTKKKHEVPWGLTTHRLCLIKLHACSKKKNKKTFWLHPRKMRRGWTRRDKSLKCLPFPVPSQICNPLLPQIVCMRVRDSKLNQHLLQTHLSAGTPSTRHAAPCLSRSPSLFYISRDCEIKNDPPLFPQGPWYRSLFFNPDSSQSGLASLIPTTLFTFISWNVFLLHFHAHKPATVQPSVYSLLLKARALLDLLLGFSL